MAPRGKKAEAAEAKTTPKKLSPEEQFQELAESVVADAEAIKCPFEDFVEGLEAIQEAVRDRLNMARRELQGMDEDEESSDNEDEDDLNFSDDDEGDDGPNEDDF